MEEKVQKNKKKLLIWQKQWEKVENEKETPVGLATNIKTKSRKARQFEFFKRLNSRRIYEN